MTATRHMFVSAILCITCFSTARAADVRQSFAADVRLSAIIKGQDETMVGLTGTDGSWTVFKKVGDRYRGFDIVGADYDAEEVTLVKDRETVVLKLLDDPDLPRADFYYPFDINDPNTWPADFKGPGIEKFLRENPAAVVKLPFAPKPPENPEPIVGFGEGIENALKDKPELRERLMQPVAPGSRGPGIEAALQRMQAATNAP